MARIYTAQFRDVVVSAVQDFFEVLATSGRPILIHGFSLFQTSDVGDAAEEILRVETVRGVGSVTPGSGGTTAGVQPVDDNDAAFGGTVTLNNTIRMAAGTGSLENLEQFGWNVRIPMIHFWTPETRPRVNPGDRWTLSLAVTPADALTTSGMLWLEEI